MATKKRHPGYSFYDDKILLYYKFKDMYPDIDKKSDPAPTTTNSNDIRPSAGAYTYEELQSIKNNQVKEPAHYQIFPDTQVIDVIRNALTEEEFIGFCKGNILKYRLRDKQNRSEDYEKSKEYQRYLQDW